MAVKNGQVYKCPICGNITEILHGGGPVLVCCGKPMDLLEENTVDAAQEKHVPVVEKIDGGYKVYVGEVQHPMEPDHFIEFIELIADGVVYRKHFNPGDTPEAIFMIEAENVTAREYCNLHGLWKA